MLELVIAVAVAAAYVSVVAVYTSRRVNERASREDATRAL
jgi:hypothetical protein